MADILEDIKSRVDIVTVVSPYVQLKKIGRNFKGLCPFHSEKTPSFIVSPEKQICHCFGCNKGGDIFAFTQEIEGVTFPEAVEFLADKAGIKVENIKKLKKSEGKSEKDEYFHAHELACGFFEDCLHKSNDGKKVLDYLHRRGVTDETIKEFRIGFAPDEYEALHPYLLKKGISKKVMMNSGFVASKTVTDDKIYDKFRSRLMFPIYDMLGRMCGFGGRALKEDQMPKYLNSPENIVYNKSKTLYGYSHAKQAIKSEDRVILVEGYFDMIIPYQSGVKNIVATSGTALTSDHVRLIKRITSRVITSFDTDKAGFEATRRAYSLLQKQEMDVKVLEVIGEKDPADYVLKHGDKFKELVDKSKDFFSFYIDKLIIQNDISTSTGRKGILMETLPLLKEMSSTARDYCVREFAEKLNVNEKSLYDDINKFELPFNHPAKEEAAVESKRISLEETVLGVLLQYPLLFPEISDKLEEKYFSLDYVKEVYNELARQYNSTRENFRNWDLEERFLAQYREKLNIVILYVEDGYGVFSEDALRDELKKLVDKMKNDFKAKKLKEVHLKIIEAEKNDDKKALLEFLEEQQRLLMN